MKEEVQKVLQFPKLCRGCKKVATVNDHGNYFCETCYQSYEVGSRRLKRVLYQIQRMAKIGKVQLKGIALCQEGDVGLRLSLTANVPHSYASEQEAKTGVDVVKDKIHIEQPQQKVVKGWRHALPPKPPELPKEPIKPLVLRPINEPGTRQEAPAL